MELKKMPERDISSPASSYRQSRHQATKNNLLMQQVRFIHFPISVGSYSLFIEKIISLAVARSSSYVCVANVHMFIEAYQDKKFSQVINEADIVTPDGVPLTWGLSAFKGIKQDRVAGMDLLPDLLTSMVDKGLSAYFYGGSQSLLDATGLFLKNNFPTLKVAGLHSPPFRELTAAENDEMVNKINASGAGVVFVVLGCPKQEKWMATMKGRINACMIGIGGALPVIVGINKRAPKWMQQVGLEWLYRLCLEPRRLFKRYAVTNTMFFYLSFKEFVKTRIFRKPGTS